MQYVLTKCVMQSKVLKMWYLGMNTNIEFHMDGGYFVMIKLSYGLTRHFQCSCMALLTCYYLVRCIMSCAEQNMLM